MNQVDMVEARVAALQMRLSELENGGGITRGRIERAAEDLGMAGMTEDEVFALVAGHVGSSPAEIRGRFRGDGQVGRRRAAARILHGELGWSKRRIARLMERNERAVRNML